MDLGWRLTFTDYLDDVSTVYKGPFLMPTGAADLYDQRPYLVDVDARYQRDPGGDRERRCGHGAQQYQYGYWVSNGDSPPSENKRGDPHPQRQLP